MKKHKRLALIGIVVGGAVVVVTAVALRFVSPSTTSAPALTQQAASSTHVDPNPDIEPQVAAVVSAVSGSVTVMRNGSRTPVTYRMKLVAGDAVSVADDASLTVTWPNYGRSVFAGGTAFDVVRAFESTDRLRIYVRLSFRSGSVWSMIERPIGPASSFSIRSGNVLVATSGGTFGLQLPKTNLFIQTLEGSTDVMRVEDKPTTPEERKAGSDADTMEHVVGKGAGLDAGEELTVSMPASDLPAVATMSDRERATAQAATAPLAATEEELQITPLE